MRNFYIALFQSESELDLLMGTAVPKVVEDQSESISRGGMYVRI